MHRKWLLMAGVSDLFILSLLDRVAFRYYFYWRFPLFDILMHLIGGVAIGLVSSYSYWAWQKEEKLGNPITNSQSLINWRSFFVFNLVSILFVAIGWEVFELLADRVVRFSWLDSFKDLLFGVIGSLLVGLLVGIIVLWIHNYKQKRLK